MVAIRHMFPALNHEGVYQAMRLPPLGVDVPKFYNKINALIPIL
jgi:hypothetical protein